MLVDAMELHGHLDLDQVVKTKVLLVSAATIDLVLGDARSRFDGRHKRRTGGRSGSHNLIQSRRSGLVVAGSRDLPRRRRGCLPSARRRTGSETRLRALRRREAAQPPFWQLAHGEIRCESGFCLFFPRDASIDAVHAQAPSRELCHDLRSHPSERATGTAAGSEACPALASWLSFLAVS